MPAMMEALKPRKSMKPTPLHKTSGDCRLLNYIIKRKICQILSNPLGFPRGLALSVFFKENDSVRADTRTRQTETLLGCRLHGDPIAPARERRGEVLTHNNDK